MHEVHLSTIGIVSDERGGEEKEGVDVCRVSGSMDVYHCSKAFRWDVAFMIVGSTYMLSLSMFVGKHGKLASSVWFCFFLIAYFIYTCM